MFALLRFWLLAIAVADVHYFRYERPLSGSPSQASQTCVRLMGRSYAHSQPLLADLRLYRDGKETPYVVRIAEPVAAASKNIAPLNLGEQGGHVVFDAAMPEGSYNDVELDLAADDFIATVDVFGRQSQTGARQQKLAHTQSSTSRARSWAGAPCCISLNPTSAICTFGSRARSSRTM